MTQREQNLLELTDFFAYNGAWQGGREHPYKGLIVLESDELVELIDLASLAPHADIRSFFARWKART